MIRRSEDISQQNKVENCILELHPNLPGTNNELVIHVHKMNSFSCKTNWDVNCIPDSQYTIARTSAAKYDIDHLLLTAFSEALLRYLPKNLKVLFWVLIHLPSLANVMAWRWAGDKPLPETEMREMVNPLQHHHHWLQGENIVKAVWTKWSTFCRWHKFSVAFSWLKRDTLGRIYVQGIYCNTGKSSVVHVQCLWAMPMLNDMTKYDSMMLCCQWWLQGYKYILSWAHDHYDHSTVAQVTFIVLQSWPYWGGDKWLKFCRQHFQI